MLPTKSPIAVEEFHGPYGPYHVSELVLQRIWLHQAFDASRLVDQMGRRIEVVHPGKWNRLDGPDFRGAALRIDGVETHGDVEVHFSQADWNAHGHADDPAYGNVVLHVLYHEVGQVGREARGLSGDALPRVSLLPLLWYSLEEYAADDSLVASARVDLRPEVEKLLELDLPGRRQRLEAFALRRWKMKLHFAGMRIERLGWRAACHQSALEVMGYARNRVPMLMIADRWGLKAFAKGEADVEAALAIGEGRWRLTGCRPSNYPRRRLEQYAALCRNRPDWPERARELLSASGIFENGGRPRNFGTAASRVGLGIPRIRKALLGETLGDAIGGQKADTLVCDAILPLVCARTGSNGFPTWFHWHLGNGPAECLAALKTLQVLEPRAIPLSNGWLQGMLGARSEAREDA